MTKKPASLKQQFKTWLSQQPAETLVAMLLEVAQRDDRLAQTLLVKSTPAGDQGTLADDLRLVIDDVTTVTGFVDWREIHSFVDPLDQAGLRAYRALAQAQWDALGPAEAKGHFDEARFNITRVMEDMAKASGDVDELVAIKSRDLSSASEYLGIAEILANDKRREVAASSGEVDDGAGPSAAICGVCGRAARQLQTQAQFHQVARRGQAVTGWRRVCRTDYTP